MTAFSEETLRGVFEEIERLLGQLQGVELVKEWCVRTYDEYMAWGRENGATVGNGNWLYSVTTDAGAVQYFLPIYDAAGPMGHWATHADLNSAASATYLNGPKWASGIGDYFSSVCDWFASVDAKEVQSIGGQVSKVSVDLASATPDSPGIKTALSPTGDFQGWTASRFLEFYDDIQNAVPMYQGYLEVSTATVAAAGVALEAGQVSALQFAEAARDALRTCLQEWVVNGGWEPGIGTVPGPIVNEKIVSVLAIVGKVAAFIPHPLAKGAGKVASTTASVLKVANGIASNVDYALDLKTDRAEQFYLGLERHVRAIQQEVSDALHRLEFGGQGQAGLGAVRDELVEMGSAYDPVTVPGAGNPDGWR